MYVNTQSLDAWEPEAAARGAPEESPKKDLFDMSKPPRWEVSGAEPAAEGPSRAGGLPSCVPQPRLCQRWLSPEQCRAERWGP